jgi:uncharacterized protein (TIGR02646 family)
MAVLARLARQVAAAANPAAEAIRLWKYLPQSTKAAIRQTLTAMSTGNQRCMYCEDSHGTDIEHYRPKSAYPQHAFDWLNHLLACAHCNSNYKRARFPLDADGRPLLLDPSVDNPLDHLFFSPSTGRFEPIDRRGGVTIDICGLNREVCIVGRSDAWIALTELLIVYADSVQSGQVDRAARVLGTVRRYPFQSIRLHMIRVATNPVLADVLPAETRAALSRFPELSAD